MSKQGATCRLHTRPAAQGLQQHDSIAGLLLFGYLCPKWVCVCSTGEAGPSSAPDAAHILAHQISGRRIAAACVMKRAVGLLPVGYLCPNWVCLCFTGEAGPRSAPDAAHILAHQISGRRIAAAWAVATSGASSETEPSQPSRLALEGAESLRRGSTDVMSRRGSMDPGSGAFGAALAAAVRRASPARKTARSLSYVS